MRRSSAGETGHKLKKRNFSWSALQNSLAYIYKLLSLSCSCVVPETLGRLPEESYTPMYIKLHSSKEAKYRHHDAIAMRPCLFMCV